MKVYPSHKPLSDEDLLESIDAWLNKVLPLYDPVYHIREAQLSPFREAYGERPRHRYQNAYHKTSKTGAWYAVVGTAKKVTNIALPHFYTPIEFEIVGANNNGVHAPVEFYVLSFKMAVQDRDTGVKYSAREGLTNGCILPLNYTPEQLAHRAMWLVRSGMDHEWREHFKVDGRRVLDPHGKTELQL